MSDFEKFLDGQFGSASLEPGEFTLSKDIMLKKYASLLPDYRSGLLFFFQAAERWGADLVDVKVRAWRVEIEIHFPSEFSAELEEIRADPSILESFLPPTHPLYELGHGHKILLTGNVNCTQTAQVIGDSKLLIIHHDDRSLWSRIKISTFPRVRYFLTLVLLNQLWNQVEIRIDTRPLPANKAQCHARLYRGFGRNKTGEDATPEILAHFLPPGRRPIFLEQPWEETAFPVTIPGLPVFQLELESPDHEILFLTKPFTAPLKTSFVPVRYGVALEPIESKEFFGFSLVAFRADHLQTDLSGLKLVQNEAYNEAVEKCKEVLIGAFKRLYKVQFHYQPIISRAEMLKQAGFWTIGAPVMIGLALGGPGLIYATKSILVKAMYGATAAGGFHSYAKHIPNPETYTEAMRAAHLGWMFRPDLLETMKKYGVDPGSLHGGCESVL